MAMDWMKITILPDGLIKTVTEGSISAVNHANASDFVKQVDRLAGGPVKVVPNHHRPLAHEHTHEHDHTHEH